MQQEQSDVKQVDRARGTAGASRVLVTGSHRSGSTWVGRMLARSPAIRYIHEPFNPDAFKPGICAARFAREFTYVCAENAAAYHDDLKRCLEFRYGFAEGLKTVRRTRDAVRVLRDAGRFALSRWCKMRPLLKDPHAIFSAEWLAQSFDMDVVVLVRHPAAFVGSIKQAGWAFQFGQFLEQPLLMQHHLHPFEAEIEAFATKPADIVEQGILLWNVIHHVILKYRNDHPDWIFLRHEDISREPDVVFSRLFMRLSLNYTDALRRVIADFSGPHNPGEQHTGSEIRRDSKANIWNWKQRLTADEIQRIRAQTRAIASHFYSDEDWHNNQRVTRGRVGSLPSS